VAIPQLSAGLVNNLLGAATVNLDTITAARLVISVTATPADPVAQVSSIQRLDMGIGVMSEEAFAVGITASPDPRVSVDAPPRGWLWRDSMTIVIENTTGLEQGIFSFPNIRADLRAMRKVDRGVLFLVTAKTAISGAERNIDLSGLIRVLCLT